MEPDRHPAAQVEEVARRAEAPQDRETSVTTGEMSSMPESGATEAAPMAGMAKRKASMATQNPPPAGGGAVYGFGMMGALVYFLGTAESRQDYVLAFGKAIVWPALLVYRAFKVLGG